MERENWQFETVLVNSLKNTEDFCNSEDKRFETETSKLLCFVINIIKPEQYLELTDILTVDLVCHTYLAHDEQFLLNTWESEYSERDRIQAGTRP